MCEKADRILYTGDAVRYPERRVKELEAKLAVANKNREMWAQLSCKHCQRLGRMRRAFKRVAQEGPRYSGQHSRSFWRRVNYVFSLDADEWDKVYAMGVGLQNLEEDVLARLGRLPQSVRRGGRT